MSRDFWELFDPSRWADPDGAIVFWLILGLILIGCLRKLAGAQWDDWLDERWGRGSVRDWWLLHKIERDSAQESTSGDNTEQRSARCR